MLPLELLFLRRWRRRAISALPAGTSWLEVGAGPGSNTPFFPIGARVVVSDISLAMRPAVVAEAERLPFRDGTFGAALATLVLCNVIDDGQALTELRRVLRAGAPLAMIEHVRPESRIGGWLADVAERGDCARARGHHRRDHRDRRGEHPMTSMLEGGSRTRSRQR